jgi:hypothetical protein
MHHGKSLIAEAGSPGERHALAGSPASSSRARRQTRGSHSRGALTIYRLGDEPSAIILVACTKCDWKAAYSRDELIALHGADRAMPDLLDDLALSSGLAV